jgi:hypothetical protein
LAHGASDSTATSVELHAWRAIGARAGAEGDADRLFRTWGVHRAAWESV